MYKLKISVAILLFAWVGAGLIYYINNLKSTQVEIQEICLEVVMLVITEPESTFINGKEESFQKAVDLVLTFDPQILTDCKYDGSVEMLYKLTLLKKEALEKLINVAEKRKAN